MTTTRTYITAGLGLARHAPAESGKGDRESGANPTLCGVRAFRHRLVTQEGSIVDCPRCLKKFP